MALKGSIKEFGLSEIFQLIFHQTKEGRLTLTQEKESVAILFKKGKIVRADEGDRDGTLGQNLIKAGLLTNDQLGIVKYRQEKEKNTLESLLIELEFISESELTRLLRLFTEETLYSLFHWKTGDYQFEQKVISFNPDLFTPIDPQFVLMEAVRQIDEWPALLRKIPSRSQVFECLVSPIESQIDDSPGLDEKKNDIEEDPFGLIEDLDDESEKEDLWLIQQIDNRVSVQQIIDHAHLGSFDVYQGIVDLLKEKKIQKIATDENSKEKAGFFPQRKTVLKGMVGVMSVCLTVGLFVTSYSSISNTLVIASKPLQEVKALSVRNERYFIRFALDLYYLKHNRYPDTLQNLVDEGFFGSERYIVGNLQDWTYHLSPKSGDRFQLNQK